MTYPNYKNKHLEESLFNPGDYVSYKKWSNSRMPSKYILIYQISPLKHFKREFRGKYEKIKLYNQHEVLVHRNIGFIRMNGIGSPHSVTFLEELIAMGGKYFISIGIAGGLQREGIFLCNKALRDEGTSYHYVPDGDFSYPDEKLTKKLGKYIKLQGLKFSEGATWTIDAPYRETKAEIAKYKKEGISTVEMEASALFTVAKYRKVKMASAFVVSDVLGEKWDPKFHKMDVKRSLNKLIDAAITCLTNLK